MTYLIPETIDMLTVCETAKVTSRQLREGMVLCDPDGFAVAVLDHRVGTTAGCAEWLIEDLTGEVRSHWYRSTFPISRVASITVATKVAA